MIKNEIQLNIRCPRCKITNPGIHPKDWDFFSDNCFNCGLTLPVVRVDDDPLNWKWNEWHKNNSYGMYG